MSKLVAALLIAGGGHLTASGCTRRGMGASRPAPGPPAAVTLSPLWEVSVPDTPAPFLLGLEESFVVATPSGRISLFGVEGGSPRWQVELGARITASPVHDDVALVVPVQEGSDEASS